MSDPKFVFMYESEFKLQTEFDLESELQLEFELNGFYFTGATALIFKTTSTTATTFTVFQIPFSAFKGPSEQEYQQSTYYNG